MQSHVFASDADRARAIEKFEADGRGHVTLHGSDGRLLVFDYDESDVAEQERPKRRRGQAEASAEPEQV